MVYRIVITPEQKQDDRVVLNPSQQHYLQRVLRMNNGDLIIVMNGRGLSWLAQLEGNLAHILEPITTSTELPLPITLITALPKGSGYEDIVRCCTELGVNTFIPVISDRTILKPSPNKVERWRKIATEAAEQSERQVVPQITNPIKFTQAIKQTINQESDRYICVARGDLPTLWSCLTQVPEREIILATGCEGGWSPQEIEKAIQQGFQPVSLGNRILRAITAPMVAVTIVTVRLN
ncbi:Ribosomal RNA small subunit methyltransferase E [Stanieria cyanosphaera PCC 7437]|uniref:Ribosomal RNA small subunit methyltransferase E n=1 Tax=Stanieria cyanosphaera (strain ATCC 29371 / PCC 7437) TaxID=111780 RepID=K9XPS9_STAC7|nr:16S rRNA (uracil(1498)-N(3))-methyltransferase [Stanieria cyanosphaera]AFZ34089.1 Ribosomal RNA small subunit methyltransferase E [Stanieria cyanosphaera PCC 7437]